MLLILAKLYYASSQARLTIMQVNILEAKNRLSELLKCAQVGEEVIIASRGRPIVQLVPLGSETDAKPQKGSGAALVKWLKERDALGPRVTIAATKRLRLTYKRLATRGIDLFGQLHLNLCT
jgi:prevent-host-death family protein